MGKSSNGEGIMTGIPRWLKLLGVGSWLVLGFIALVVGLYFGLAQLSGLLIPLAVAVVVGMIFYPLVDRLAALGLPRSLSAAIVLLGLVSITVASIFLAVKGVFDQRELISTQLTQGWAVIQDWLANQGLTLESLENLWESISSGASSGAAGNAIQAGFSSVAAFLIGLFVGAMPGLGSVNGVAILLPFTFVIQGISGDATSPMIFLAAVYYGAMYGGRISSILLNIPGDEPAMMTTLDGYPMAKAGRAGDALVLSGVASFVGAFLATIGLMLLAPILARILTPKSGADSCVDSCANPGADSCADSGADFFGL